MLEILIDNLKDVECVIIHKQKVRNGPPIASRARPFKRRDAAASVKTPVPVPPQKYSAA